MIYCHNQCLLSHECSTLNAGFVDRSNKYGLENLNEKLGNMDYWWLNLPGQGLLLMNLNIEHLIFITIVAEKKAQQNQLRQSNFLYFSHNLFLL